MLQTELFNTLEASRPVPANLNTVRVEFDGGTSCNIPRLGYGKGYGSYRIDEGPIIRCQFGPMSANAAEVLTLCEAVQSLTNVPQETVLVISGDSMIALNQARLYRLERKKPRKPKGSPEFRDACERLRAILCPFQQIETCWRGRAESVRVFGH